MEHPQPAPRLPADAHKGTAGRLLCLCGRATMPGAAILVARSAQRAGAGLVTLGCLDRELLGVLPAAAPEAVYADLAGCVDYAAFLAERPDDARLVGCGMGADTRTRKLVEALLDAESDAPLALDADALNVLAGEPDRLASCRAPVVITPHPLEAARLFGCAVPSDPDGRSACARDLARAAGAICCLKGRGTVVTDGDAVWVSRTGNPGMATAGSGDVLAGILGAYLALCGRFEGWTPFAAAASAVHVHGLAGDLAARDLGQRAVIASDLITYLPAAQLAFVRGGAGEEG